METREATMRGDVLQLPREWLDQAGIGQGAKISFDGNRIIVERPDERNTIPLANDERIRRFSLVWLQIYRNHANIPRAYFKYPEFLEVAFSELGFSMDGAAALQEQFPGVNAFWDNDALESVLERVDLQTLGNAIFSKWYYMNQMTEYGDMEEHDYEWFVIAFIRLAELATGSNCNLGWMRGSGRSGDGSGTA